MAADNTEQKALQYSYKQTNFLDWVKGLATDWALLLKTIHLAFRRLLEKDFPPLSRLKMGLAAAFKIIICMKPLSLKELLQTISDY
jgi:hypothetical protein